MQIAIDGPAGAGKSTIAKKLAETLGFTYIDTGAMYRAVTLKCLEDGLELDVENPELVEAARNSSISFDGNKVYLNGRDVSKEIRSEDVTANVSLVSSIKEIRDLLVLEQQRIASGESVVMDGRDIGSVVLPEAELKVYLDASPECRAKRRANEIGLFDPDEIEKMKEKIIRRDLFDASRENSPLVRVEDAYYLLTDTLTVEEVVKNLLGKVREEA